MVKKAPVKKKSGWIGKAMAKMEKKGTVGKFGKATPKKIAIEKEKGGKPAKEALFAANMKKMAEKRGSSRRKRNIGRS